MPNLKCLALTVRKIWRGSQKTSQVTWCAFSHIWGAKGGNRIVMKFCIGVGVPDTITLANLDDDRFRGFWRSGGRIPHFSIDLRCRPYNTLALPCQRVMISTAFIAGMRRRLISYTKLLHLPGSLSNVTNRYEMHSAIT